MRNTQFVVYEETVTPLAFLAKYNRSVQLIDKIQNLLSTITDEELSELSTLGLWLGSAHKDLVVDDCVHREINETSEGICYTAWDIAKCKSLDVRATQYYINSSKSRERRKDFESLTKEKLPRKNVKKAGKP